MAKKKKIIKAKQPAAAQPEKQAPASAAKAPVRSKPGQSRFAMLTQTGGTLQFSKMNYQLMIAGLVVIAIGFILMAGGGPDPEHPEIANNAAKYSFRRIVLAPIVVMLGFGVELYAILHKEKQNNASE